MRLADLQAFAQGFDQGDKPSVADETYRLLREAESHAIERAIKGWAAQAGVSVEKWAESFGFQVSHVYEGTKVTVRVEPVALGFSAGRPLTRVVFPQPVEETVR